MPNFKKVYRGQNISITAADWNGAMEAAEDYSRKKTVFGAEMIAGQHGDLVKVRNETGAAVSIGAVLGIDGPIIRAVDNLNEWRNNPAFRGVVPNFLDHNSRFVIAIHAIPNGKIGGAIVSGIAPAMVHMDDDEDRFADIFPGDVTMLRSGPGSARLIAVQPRIERASPNVARCWVQLGTQEWQGWVKITGATVLTANRWLYSGVEQRPRLITGKVTFEDRDYGGGSSSGPQPAQTWTDIYNVSETFNVNTRSLQPSTGVNQGGSAYPPGFNVKPLAPGLVVPLRFRKLVENGEKKLIPWVCYHNADDGVCT